MHGHILKLLLQKDNDVFSFINKIKLLYILILKELFIDSKKQRTLSIELINYYGQTVEYINKFQIAGSRLHLYLKQPSGLYLLKIVTKNNTITELVICR